MTRELVPVAPFRDWLLRRLASGITVHELALETGTSDRRLREIRDNRSSLVALDTVDRALLSSDTLLSDLYPALYEEAVA